MLFPDSLPGLIRMTHRFARRVVHPWTVPPWGGSSSGGSISTVVAGCDEEPHPGPRQVGRCDEFGGAVDRPACEPGRRLEMWAQFSVTLVVVVGIAVTLLPIIAAILMLLSPGEGGQRVPAGLAGADHHRDRAVHYCSLSVRPQQVSSSRLPVTGVIKIILGALLLFLAPRLWDSGSEPVPLRGRIRCGT
jgi:hypothetical protein